MSRAHRSVLAIHLGWAQIRARNSTMVCAARYGVTHCPHVQHRVHLYKVEANHIGPFRQREMRENRIADVGDADILPTNPADTFANITVATRARPQPALVECPTTGNVTA